ncbi:alpha/beta fold hydrolase [Streptomyces sp. NBC_01497]|uniref:alpha/beta fold hydrolase n=1 Tax=Streptomyces sp. NBC_01497 TaxID=2903885 RepID=UPI002E2F41DC|nr:alpha/beta hydrolase [Streptomyces sp. NBC_01497]
MKRQLDLPDARIVFTVTGNGETVLLLHGGFSPDWFTPVASRMPGYQVVTMQRTGYGESEDLTGGASVVAYADHAAAVVRAVGTERAHVVGHSAGGGVALQLTNAHPELVGTLALLETAFPYAPDEPAMPGMPRAIAAAKEGNYERAFDEFMSSLSGPGYRDVFTRELGEAGLHRAVDNTPYFFAAEGPAFAAWSFGPDEMRAIGVPVLLAVGAVGEQRNTPHRARAAHLARYIPDTESAVLPGVSHSLPLEDPDLVARTITDFVSRHPLS